MPSTHTSNTPKSDSPSRSRRFAARTGAAHSFVARQVSIEHGRLPPVYVLHADEGRQYFAMHDDLRAILQEHLRSRATASAKNP